MSCMWHILNSATWPPKSRQLYLLDEYHESTHAHWSCQQSCECMYALHVWTVMWSSHRHTRTLHVWTFTFVSYTCTYIARVNTLISCTHAHTLHVWTPWYHAHMYIHCTCEHMRWYHTHMRIRHTYKRGRKAPATGTQGSCTLCCSNARRQKRKKPRKISVRHWRLYTI